MTHKLKELIGRIDGMLEHLSFCYLPTKSSASIPTPGRARCTIYSICLSVDELLPHAWDTVAFSSAHVGYIYGWRSHNRIWRFPRGMFRCVHPLYRFWRHLTNFLVRVCRIFGDLERGIATERISRYHALTPTPSYFTLALQGRRASSFSGFHLDEYFPQCPFSFEILIVQK